MFYPSCNELMIECEMLWFRFELMQSESMQVSVVCVLFVVAHLLFDNLSPQSVEDVQRLSHCKNVWLLHLKA